MASTGRARCGTSCPRRRGEHPTRAGATLPVERLMRAHGLRGVRRGRQFVTTRPDPAPTPGGPGRAGLHRDRTEPVVGGRLHLRRDLVRDGVHRVRHRRVLPADRRLAHRSHDAHRAAARRVGDGAVDPRPSRTNSSRDSSITATPAANTPRSATPNGSPTPARSPRSAPSATRYDNALAES